MPGYEFELFVLAKKRVGWGETVSERRKIGPLGPYFIHQKDGLNSPIATQTPSRTPKNKQGAIFLIIKFYLVNGLNPGVSVVCLV